MQRRLAGKAGGERLELHVSGSGNLGAVDVHSEVFEEAKTPFIRSALDPHHLHHRCH